MFGEIGRLPSWHRGVALHANIVNSRREVVGIGGGVVIHLMTGETIGRHIGIVARYMTLITIIDGVTLA